MRHEEGTFECLGGDTIYYQSWLPDGQPKAALLIVHGLAEHSGRYGNVVNHLVPLGYAAYGLDHIGHGKSSGTRVCCRRIEDYTTTLKAYCDMVRGWQPGKPVFLVGHSLGGLLGTLYLLDHQADLAGAVISAPAVKVPAGISPVTVALGKVLSTLSPTFGVLGLEFDALCRDPAVVQAYVADPLVYTGKTTARLSAEMLRGMKRVEAEAAKITRPILILQGSADRLVDPDGARMLYAKAGSTDKTLKIYDGFYHEVFNEPERAEVLRDVEVWLAAHLPGA